MKPPAVLCLISLHCGFLAAQPARTRATGEAVKGESRVIAKQDLEILTYETAPDFERLEALHGESLKSAPAPGSLTTQYLRSRTDGSVQPYAIWLPKSYRGAEEFPLLIQLHGIGPKILAGQRIGWKGMVERQWIDPDAPVIVAHCFGRSNTFYQGMGEEDVLETVEEIRRRFSVDPARVYLMGHSMGGAGTYTVGLHHPDRFGSLTLIDPAMWTQPREAEPEPPQWMTPQIAIQKVANLYPNARNVNVFVKNAGAVIGKQSTEFSDGIVAGGGFSTTESFPGMPHHFAPQFSYGAFTAMAVLHPIRHNPPEVKFYTNTLRYNRAYWVTIDRLERHNADVRVTAAFDDGKPRTPVGMPPGARPSAPVRPPSVTVTTANVAALTLRLGDAEVPKEDPVPLLVDGGQVLNGRLPSVVHLTRDSGKWRLVNSPALAGKRHGVQGPIGDAFNSKFLAVYGEGDKDMAVAELDAIRNPPGRLAIQGDFPMKAAGKVTAGDVKTSNLILFGTPQTNSILRRIAGALPSALLQAQPGSGVIFIYPNPENRDRYVVVWTARLLGLPHHGLRAGYVMPVNLLPDYVRVRNGKIIAAGHFDNDWKL